MQQASFGSGSCLDRSLSWFQFHGCLFIFGSKQREKEVTLILHHVTLASGLILMVKNECQEKPSILFSERARYELQLLSMAIQNVINLWRIEEGNSGFSLYAFSQIKEATGNFSSENKLGQGGFGPVYKVTIFELIFNQFLLLYICYKLCWFHDS